MTTNLNPLFDFSKWPKRKPVKQKQFETDNHEVLVSFTGAVHSSFEKLHKRILKVIEPIDQSNNLCATVMNGYLCGFFKRRHLYLCRNATRQRFKLMLNETSVYIKKLDEKTKLPSNIPTDESLRIYYQLSENENSTDKKCNIFLGYTVNEPWSMITGIFAVCIEGDELIWLSDLNDLAEDMKSPVAPMPPPTPIAPKVRPGVKRNDKKQIE